MTMAQGKQTSGDPKTVAVDTYGNLYTNIRNGENEIAIDNPFPIANTTEYLIEVALGNITGHTQIELSAENKLINSIPETVWPVGGRYVFPMSASTLTVLSTSGDDSLSGTGARTVTINGLNASYVAISETVNMDGTNPVTTNVEFLRVNELVVATAGTGLNAVGNIDVKHGTDILARIEANKNISRQGVFTVPAGTTLVLNNILFNSGIDGEGLGILYITNKTNNIQFYSSGYNFFESGTLIILNKVVLETEDIEIVARNTTGGGDIKMQFLLNSILRDN